VPKEKHQDSRGLPKKKRARKTPAAVDIFKIKESTRYNSKKIKELIVQVNETGKEMFGGLHSFARNFQRQGHINIEECANFLSCRKCSKQEHAELLTLLPNETIQGCRNFLSDRTL
jgi:hypothetical protein